MQRFQVIGEIFFEITCSDKLRHFSSNASDTSCNLMQTNHDTLNYEDITVMHPERNFYHEKAGTFKTFQVLKFNVTVDYLVPTIMQLENWNS